MTNKKQLNIRSYASFEEMENGQLKYFASLTPEQALKNLKQLVLASFGVKNETILKGMPRIINLKPRQWIFSLKTTGRYY